MVVLLNVPLCRKEFYFFTLMFMPRMHSAGGHAADGGGGWGGGGFTVIR